MCDRVRAKREGEGERGWERERRGGKYREQVTLWLPVIIHVASGVLNSSH